MERKIPSKNVFSSEKLDKNRNINYENLATSFCRLQVFYLPRR